MIVQFPSSRFTVIAKILLQNHCENSESLITLSKLIKLISRALNHGVPLTLVDRQAPVKTVPSQSFGCGR